jgi:eukaryotic-like serine/threonine-protein kinase
MVTVSKSMRAARGATVSVTPVGNAALVKVTGVLDERFEGFGTITAAALVIDLAGVVRVTSFGVRQWLIAMTALSSEAGDLYLVNCPPFIVDQLNMVKGFGGRAKVLTLVAPYTCTTCSHESDEVIDVVVDRDVITRGDVPERQCRRCGNQLAFDEIPESYFACVASHGATTVDPVVASVVASHVMIEAATRPVHAVDASQPLPPVRPPDGLSAAAPGDELRDKGLVVSTLGLVLFALVVGALVVGAFFVGKYS